MALRAEEPVRLTTVHRGTIEKVQHTAHLLVQLLGAILPLLDESLVRRSQVVVVVGIRGSHGKPVGPRAELEVETVGDGLLGIMTATPVANDHTVKSPVVLQNLVEQRGIMAIVLVLIKVIGTHDAPCPTLLHGSTEGRQVDFVKGTVADNDVHLMTVLLIVVQGIVLHTGGDTLRLQTLHIRHHHARYQPRVFTHIFKITSSQRCAVDVDTGTQYHMLVPIQGLFAQTLAIKACQLGIPRCSQTGQCRECHARVVGLTRLYPLVPQHVRAHTVRTVVRPQVGKSQTFHTRTRELGLCMYHGYLLVERHA